MPSKDWLGLDKCLKLNEAQDSRWNFSLKKRKEAGAQNKNKKWFLIEMWRNKKSDQNENDKMKQEWPNHEMAERQMKVIV